MFLLSKKSGLLLDYPLWTMIAGTVLTSRLMVVFFAAAAALLPACVICASDIKLSVIFFGPLLFIYRRETRHLFFFFFFQIYKFGGLGGFKTMGNGNRFLMVHSFSFKSYLYWVFIDNVS